MPRVPEKVVPTLTEKEVANLLAQPDKHTAIGFRDFALMLALLDTVACPGDMTGLPFKDVDLENGYLRAMGKGSPERLISIAQKVAGTLLRLPSPADRQRPFLAYDGRPGALHPPDRGDRQQVRKEGGH